MEMLSVRGSDQRCLVFCERAAPDGGLVLPQGRVVEVGFEPGMERLRVVCSGPAGQRIEEKLHLRTADPDTLRVLSLVRSLCERCHVRCSILTLPHPAAAALPPPLPLLPPPPLQQQHHLPTTPRMHSYPSSVAITAPSVPAAMPMPLALPSQAAAAAAAAAAAEATAAALVHAGGGLNLRTPLHPDNVCSQAAAGAAAAAPAPEAPLLLNNIPDPACRILRTPPIPSRAAAAKPAAPAPAPAPASAPAPAPALEPFCDLDVAIGQVGQTGSSARNLVSSSLDGLATGRSDTSARLGLSLHGASAAAGATSLLQSFPPTSPLGNTTGGKGGGGRSSSRTPRASAAAKGQRRLRTEAIQDRATSPPRVPVAPPPAMPPQPAAAAAAAEPAQASQRQTRSGGGQGRRKAARRTCRWDDSTGSTSLQVAYNPPLPDDVEQALRAKAMAKVLARALKGPRSLDAAAAELQKLSAKMAVA